jgi:hypothetical protein
MAFDRQVELQSEAQLRRENEHRALTGDPALSRQPEKLKQQSMEDMLLTIGEKGVRAGLKADYQRKGEHMPKDVEITPQAINRYLLDNPASWSRQWATNKIPTDRVKQLGNMVVHNIGRVDITESDATNLQNDLNSLMVLRGEAPEFFADHFADEDAAKLVQYHQQMTMDGSNPFEVVQRLREADRLRERGLDFTPTPEQSASGSEAVIESFVRDHGEWSILPARYAIGTTIGALTGVRETAKIPAQLLLQTFGIDRPFEDVDYSKVAMSFKDMVKIEPEMTNQMRIMATRYYDEAFTRTGDSELSVAEASQRLNKGSIVIGGRAILDGAKLNETSFGGNFDRYLEGLDDDTSNGGARQALISEYSLPEDFSLRNGFNRVVPYPDGRGATIFIKGADGAEKPVIINTPTRADHLLPTTGEQYWESVRGNLFESRGGGSFSSQPGMSGE